MWSVGASWVRYFPRLLRRAAHALQGLPGPCRAVTVVLVADERRLRNRARSGKSFCDAFAGALDHTGISEICIREGLADQGKLDEIVAALRRFGTDTSNCFALAWGEAVAYKPD